MHYTLVRETVKDDVLGSYESFGIENETGYRVSDISTNIQDVKKLISRINAQQTPENYLLYEIDRLFSEI